MHEMIRRQRAVDACVQRFAGKPYAPGSRDCVKLAGHALHKMGRRVGLTKGVRYTSERGALKALKALGFADLLAAMDATGRPRIAPAAALPGDILALAADGPFGCGLAVYAGNGAALAYQDGHDGAVMLRLETPPLAAWRA